LEVTGRDYGESRRGTEIKEIRALAFGILPPVWL